MSNDHIDYRGYPDAKVFPAYKPGKAYSLQRVRQAWVDQRFYHGPLNGKE